MSETTQELQPYQPQGGAVVRPEPEMTVREMFSSVMSVIKSGGLTAEGAQAANEALKMCERMEDRRAKREWIRSFVTMEPEMQTVQATKEVRAKDGTLKYKVAPIEEIDAMARPIYLRHGFAVSFSEGARETGLVTEYCIVRHIEGHEERTPFTVRIGSGPYGASETQADSAAHTTAQRRAYCAALHIIIGHEEDDANNVGQPITAEQAAHLEGWVKHTGSNRELFLKFAGAKSFPEIMSSRLVELEAMLAKREAKQKADMQKRINESKP